MPDRGESGRERRAAIEEILRTEPVRSQTELLSRLRRRGFRVTQPSVSRDLHELHVVKVGGRYMPADSVVAPEPHGPDLAELAGFVLTCVPAGPNLLVVKTPAGGAQPVGLALDHADWPEVVGTVAGDDTLFVATAGRRQQVHVQARLARLAVARETQHA